MKREETKNPTKSVGYIHIFPSQILQHLIDISEPRKFFAGVGEKK